LKLDLALASVIPAKAFIGVTFTKVPTPEQINDLKAITGGKRTPAVRLVIGEQLDDLPKWAEVIDGIHALGGIAVIQVRDAVVRRWKSHEDNIARIDKLLKGLLRSCEKRDIPTDRVVLLADEIEREMRNTMEREVTTKAIGELVMEKLKGFDEVAYIRFASVYRKFADISMFKEELEELLREKRGRD